MSTGTAFRAKCVKTVFTHVGVGMAAASFWRGAWYVLDDTLYPEDPSKSALASLGMGVLGMGASQGIVSKAEVLRGTVQKFARFGALYTIACSCVLVWRGTWIMWDVVYEKYHECPIEKSGPKSTDPGHATKSGLFSHGVAIGGLLATGLFASVLAPPAAASVIRDLAVKTGQRAYSGPAQGVVQKLMHSSRSITTQATKK